MNELSKIPHDFHQQDTNSLIENCKICNRYLLDETANYLLEKAIKTFPEIEAEEVIFEYAICIDCARMHVRHFQSNLKKILKLFFQATRSNKML